MKLNAHEIQCPQSMCFPEGDRSSAGTVPPEASPASPMSGADRAQVICAASSKESVRICHTAARIVELPSFATLSQNGRILDNLGLTGTFLNVRIFLSVFCMSESDAC